MYRNFFYSTIFLFCSHSSTLLSTNIESKHQFLFYLCWNFTFVLISHATNRHLYKFFSYLIIYFLHLFFRYIHIIKLYHIYIHCILYIFHIVSQNVSQKYMNTCFILFYLDMIILCTILGKKNKKIGERNDACC